MPQFQSLEELQEKAENYILSFSIGR